MNQGNGPSLGYVSKTIYPETIDAYEKETSMTNAQAMILRAPNQGHWATDDRNQVVEGYGVRRYEGTRDVMARALRDGATLTNITLKTLKRYGWAITPLPDDPPNPFPTASTRIPSKDFYCGLFLDNGDDIPAQSLNKSDSLFLL